MIPVLASTLSSHAADKLWFTDRYLCEPWVVGSIPTALTILDLPGYTEKRCQNRWRKFNRRRTSTPSSWQPRRLSLGWHSTACGNVRSRQLLGILRTRTSEGFSGNPPTAGRRAR